MAEKKPVTFEQIVKKVQALSILRSRIVRDFSLMGIIASLVADATIALSIRGKYADKDSRGVKVTMISLLF